jgi:hypothetical protein
VLPLSVGVHEAAAVATEATVAVGAAATPLLLAAAPANLEKPDPWVGFAGGPINSGTRRGSLGGVCGLLELRDRRWAGETARISRLRTVEDLR